MKVRLTLEYDGARFRGWARQPAQRTVEGVMRDALDQVAPGWSNLSVAGRTDTGVHASGQVVSVSITQGPEPADLPRALNTSLPEDVSALSAEPAADSFDARFSATGRAYRYVVLTRRERAALRGGRVLWWPHPVDEPGLCAAAAELVGEHDFRAFTPSETQHQVFVRTVRAAAWERRGDELHFTIEGDSFLRHMVRTLVGTMLEGRELDPLLRGRPRAEAGLTAPPHGLVLERVEYADDDLADALLDGTLERSISHREHVRAALVILGRLGSDDGGAAFTTAIRALCDRLGMAEKFDGDLTRRWLDLLTPLTDGAPHRSLDDLLRDRPELLEPDLPGR